MFADKLGQLMCICSTCCLQFFSLWRANHKLSIFTVTYLSDI